LDAIEITLEAALGQRRRPACVGGSAWSALDRAGSSTRTAHCVAGAAPRPGRALLHAPLHRRDRGPSGCRRNASTILTEGELAPQDFRKNLRHLRLARDSSQMRGSFSRKSTTTLTVFSMLGKGVSPLLHYFRARMIEEILAASWSISPQEIPQWSSPRAMLEYERFALRSSP